MSAEAIALLLRDGGPSALAALFAYLYLSERSKNNDLQMERLGDVKTLLAEQKSAGEAMRSATIESTRQGEANTRVVEANTRTMEAVLRQTGARP